MLSVQWLQYIPCMYDQSHVFQMKKQCFFSSAPRPADRSTRGPAVTRQNRNLSRSWIQNHRITGYDSKMMSWLQHGTLKTYMATTKLTVHWPNKFRLFRRFSAGRPHICVIQGSLPGFGFRFMDIYGSTMFCCSTSYTKITRTSKY